MKLKQIKLAFNKAAARYDLASCVQKKIGQTLIKQLPKTHFHNVIDLGCGTGYTTQQLASHIDFNHLDAVDMAEAMIAEAKSSAGNATIQFKVGSFDDLTPNKYDLIFSNMALHWSSDFFITLARIHAALKSGGLIAFSLPLSGTFDELKQHFNVREFFTAQASSDMLHQHGFHLKNIHCYNERLHFDDTLQALRSLKRTGATVCEAGSVFSYQQNRAAIKNQLINQLTYQIGSFIAEKI